MNVRSMRPVWRIAAPALALACLTVGSGAPSARAQGTGTAAPATGTTDAGRFTTVAQKLEDAINANDQKALAGMFAPILQKAMPAENLGPVMTSIQQQYGKLTGVGQPSVSGSTATVRLTAEKGAVNAVITLDPQNAISGLYLTPAPPDTAPPARNATPLRLPVAGDWYVYWGGATEAENYHVRNRNQQRAIDLVKTDQQGQTHKGFGLNNTDYYSYGETISAPADATVVSVVNDVPENTPGDPNPYLSFGNLVVLRFAPNEFGVFTHVQQGSITVKPGDTVKAGQAIAKVGDSGNVTEPFLTFHLQNSPVLQDGIGFAPYFQNVKVTHGTTTSTQADYTPVRGDRVGTP